MIDVIKDVAITITLAVVCMICGYILQAKKRNILQIVTDLIQKAESTITGSNMGAVKKEKVIAQLRVMGIEVTAWLDKEIDEIVKYLNDQSGWLVDDAEDTLTDQSLQSIGN